MRVNRRVALGLGGGAVVAGSLAAGGLLAADPYAPDRRLPGGSWQPGAAAGSYGLGAHQVELGPTFRVLHRGVPIWWSTDGVLLAGRGDVDWAERHGHFTGRRRVRAWWVDATLHRVDATVTGRLGMVGELGIRGGQHLPWRMVLVSRDDVLEVEVEVTGADLVVLRSGLAPGEGVHGLGAQFTDFDLRGRQLVLATREQGVGRGKQPLTSLSELTKGAGGAPTSTYAPMPMLVTDALRSLSWDRDEVAEVDLRGDRLDLGVWSPRVTGRWAAAARPADLVRAAHEVPPSWTAGGAIIGMQGGSAEVRRKVAVLEAADAAIAGVWLQDWVGRRTTDFGSRLWWTWQLDRELYPDWEELVAELAGRGIRVLTYVNPFVVPSDDKPGGVARDLYAEAVAAGYLVRRPDGGPYLQDQDGFLAALVDLTNPAAVAWFGQVVAAQPGTGGWMADFAESLPFDAVLHDGDPAELHNRWPVLWEQLNAAVRGPEDFVFHRSAWRGARAHRWAGDQLMSWDRHDGMASALLGILAGGVSGLPVMHSDVGGYTSLPQRVVRARRDVELLLRWAEWSVWSPLLRTHEGNRPAENAQVYDPEVAAAFARHTRVYAALADYRRTVVAEDLPAMRHGWLEAPDTPAAQRDDQYFFGSAFLVAPVLDPGATRRDVALPPGRWVLVWSGEAYDGDRTVRVPAPLGQPAVLHRAEDEQAAALAARIRAV